MSSNYRVIYAIALVVGLGTGACQEAPRRQSETRAEKGKAAMEAPSKGHLGTAFAVSEITPVDKLMASPKAFEGKTVRVQGVVMSHCHHKLAWFGLRTDAQAKETLRVMTAPAFLVPKDVKHGTTKANAEGEVKLSTVPEAHAKHLAREHGLFGGEPDKISGPQYVVTLQASGASFE